MLNAVLIGAAVHIVTIPMWGALSDRLGRSPVYLLGAVGVGVWAFVFFCAARHQELRADRARRSSSGCCSTARCTARRRRSSSELFGTNVRYSGVSIGYQLASIVAGGLAPLIAVALLGAFGNGYAIAVYVALAA